MTRYVIVCHFSQYFFLFYFIDFEFGKLIFKISEILFDNVEESLRLDITANLNLFQISNDKRLNENVIVIAAFVLCAVLLFFWIKLKRKQKIRKIQSEVEKPEARESKPEVTSKVMILEETEQRILDSLVNFEKSNQFNQKEISLYNLSHEINTNTKYLSSIIKKHKNKSFNSYINELRIEYIVQKLRQNPSYLNYKISHLADEVGFSSHSAFSSVFYQVMGVKPSVFIKNLKEEMNNG